MICGLSRNRSSSCVYVYSTVVCDIKYISVHQVCIRKLFTPEDFRQSLPCLRDGFFEGLMSVGAGDNPQQTINICV